MRGTSEEALRRAALVHFARSGFEGASLQQIADDAGMSKSSVLYHFDSKEALFDAALRPALESLAALVDHAVTVGTDAEFIDRFIALLFEHRLELYTLINHGHADAGRLPVLREADEIIARFGAVFLGGDETAHLRFGFALAGAAFLVVGADRWKPADAEELDDERFRRVLTAIVTELTGSGTPAPSASVTAASAPIA